MALLIKGGRVVDPANNLDEITDILIEDSEISKIAKNIKPGAEHTIEAEGKIIMPGLVDMHVHLREPGREDKETICSATKAALHGGITAVLAMPNTNPAPDSLENVLLVKSLIKKSAKANVFICGAITKFRRGEELVDIPGLKKAGVIAISDDGASVENADLMLEAFKQAKKEDLLVICHCEDQALSNHGVVNAGFTATRTGLRGIVKESEYKRVARDIELAGKAGAKIHIAHVSCKESVEIIAAAKKKGIKVTAETAPHYFSLNEEAVLGYDTNFKMNPPLRSRSDVEAMKKGLFDGTIDVIASDHAPHTENEKEIEFERAEFGVIGLETELAVAITELVDKGLIGWSELVKKLALNPARILGIKDGSLGIGQAANIIIIDPKKESQVDKAHFLSKSKNSSFIHKTLKGFVEYTIYQGKANKWNL